MEQKTALVTAGGTSEYIDDVRQITNISTGRFGHAIAEELAAREVATTELCPRSTLERLGKSDDVAFEHFTTSDELRAELLERDERPDIIFHAAAVSDYKPVPFDGKMSSDAEEMNITLVRTPKIINELRSTYGHESFLVGFKLLSGVSEEQLVAAALQQVHKNRLNMVVANNLQNLKDGNHPIIAVTAEGGAIPFEGERGEVVRNLVDFVLKRADVNWYKSTQQTIEADNLATDRFHDTLVLAHNLHLLNDRNGNVSARGHHGLVVSPRQVDKSLLTPEDGVPVMVNQASRSVQYAGELKPSIDTGMSDAIYQAYPHVQSIIHFHNGWGRMSAKTNFPYPCGVEEEAEAVIHAVGEESQENVAVELIHHGFFLGLTDGDSERLQGEWQQASDEFLTHLEDVGTREYISEDRLRPIFDGMAIAGVVVDNPESAVVYLQEKSRSSHLGTHVIQQLKQRNYTVKTVEDCHVRDYYKRHGFSESIDSHTGAYVLTPERMPLSREF